MKWCSTDADEVEAHRLGLDAELGFLAVKFVVGNAVQVLERQMDADLHGMFSPVDCV